MKLVIKNTIAGLIIGCIIGLLTLWMSFSFLAGMLALFSGKATVMNYDFVYTLLLTGVLCGLGLLAILISVEVE